MNEEKNNIGVNIKDNNNSLPPMGTTPLQATPVTNTNNVHDKYGLPPISNFTNFNTSYEPPKVDNNTSVFDLMDQFESVNQNTINNSISVMPQMNNNNKTVNSDNAISNIPTISNEQVQKQAVPNIPNMKVINNSVLGTINPDSNQFNVNNNISEAPFNMFSGNNSIPNETNVVTNNPSIPVVNNELNFTNIPNNNLNNVNLPNQNNANNSLNIFGESINNTQENVESVNDNVQISNVNNNADFNQEFVRENNGTISTVSTNNIQNANSGNNSVEEMPTINTQNNVGISDTKNDSIVSPIEQVIPVDNNINSDISQETNNVDNTFPSFSLNNNIDTNQVVEILTTSIDNLERNNQENINPDLITNFNSDNGSSTDINNINNNKAEDSNVNKKAKKKGYKLLFIILLVVTILIVAAVGVLSYFMFFKNDKLVCGLQDYSNDQFILDESMVIRFKGNKMTDAKLTQELTFTEDNIDKKDSYLEELKNQYQGLGFNVSFIDNEDGFEIDMDFTKSELESWYGTSLKNSSKTQMKKELRDSGYTCK